MVGPYVVPSAWYPADNLDCGVGGLPSVPIASETVQYANSVAGSPDPQGGEILACFVQAANQAGLRPISPGMRRLHGRNPVQLAVECAAEDGHLTLEPLQFLAQGDDFLRRCAFESRLIRRSDLE